MAKAAKESGLPIKRAHVADEDDDVLEILDIIPKMVKAAKVATTTPINSPSKLPKAGQKVTPVRRSMMVSEPINPFSIENGLIKEVNNLLYETMSLRDEAGINSVVKQNFALIQAKLDTLMLSALHIFPDIHLNDYKKELETLPITDKTRALLNKIIASHLDDVRKALPENCKCSEMAELQGKNNFRYSYYQKVISVKTITKIWYYIKSYYIYTFK